MRRTRSHAAVVALALALLCFAAPLIAADGSATMLRVSGGAEFSTDGKTWHPLTRESRLGAGASVRSYKSGTTDIRFPFSDTVVRLTPDARIRIHKLHQTGAGDVDYEVELVSGGIACLAGSLSKRSKSQWKTTRSVVGVRPMDGGVFSLDAQGGCAASRLVLSVLAPGGNGDMLQLNPGQTFDPATGARASLNPAQHASRTRRAPN